MTPRLACRLALALAGAPIPFPVAGAQPGAPSMHAHHTAWREIDGLPTGGVTEIARTPDGYLWLQSPAGLQRFDGTHFVAFDSTRSPLLAGDPAAIAPLFVDADGILWLVRGDGAFLRYRDGWFEIAVAPDPVAARFWRGSIDRAGRKWVIVGPERSVRILEGDRLVRPRLPAELPDTGVLGVVADTGRGVWLGTRTRGTWHLGEGRNESVGGPSNVRPLLQSRDGTLWVFGDGLHTYQAGRWVERTLEGERILPPVAVETSDGAVWVGTRGLGVLRFDADGITSFDRGDGLTNAIVTDLALDDENTLWIATEAGLDRLREAPFRTLDARDGVPFEAALQVHADAHDGAWVWTYEGSRIFHVRAADGAYRAVDTRLEGFRPLAAARDGGLWVYDRDGVVFRYRDGRLESAGRLPPGRSARRGIETHSGDLWIIGVPDGLGRLRDGRYTPLVEPDTTNPSWLVEDRRGHVWASWSGSPLLLEIVDGRIVDRRDVSSGLPDHVRAPTPTGGDTVWASTAGRLIRLSPAPVLDVAVPSLAPLLRGPSLDMSVAGGTLWISSEAGVASVPLSDLEGVRKDGTEPVPARIYGPGDGLFTPKATARSGAPIAVGPDGRVWLATPAGVAVGDGRRPPRNRVPPPVHVDMLIAAGRPLPLEAEVTVPPGPDRVEIRYTTPALSGVGPVRAEYRLDGADADWRRGDPSQVASYTHLRPGRYRFRVRARNEDGVPSTGEATLSFRVRPRWYEATWFLVLLLAALLAAAASAGGLLQRVRARRRAERMQLQFDATLAERMRVARELHDSLLHGFTGLTLHLQAVHNSVSDGKAAEALSRVLALADASLTEARRTIWDMRAPELDGHTLPEAVQAAARRETEISAIDPSFAIHGVARPLDPTIEIALLRVAREAIANAVAHSGAAHIDVILDYRPDTVTLTVRDDGRGIDPGRLQDAARGGHWGIAGMRERAAREGGRLDIEPGATAGTAVQLVLPARPHP